MIMVTIMMTMAGIAAGATVGSLITRKVVYHKCTEVLNDFQERTVEVVEGLKSQMETKARTRTRIRGFEIPDDGEVTRLTTLIPIGERKEIKGFK